MQNMSYCRFRNTLEALRECCTEMDNNEELSAEEQEARNYLIKLCAQIADDYVEED